MGKQPRMLAPYSKRAVAVACHPKQEIIAVGFEDGMIMLLPHRGRRGDPGEEAGRRAGLGAGVERGRCEARVRDRGRRGGDRGPRVTG